MATNTLTLTLSCLISGELVSSAFSVKVNPTATVDELKDAIVSKKPNAFEQIDANNSVLWRATIPVGEEGVITLDNLDNKTKLGNPRTCLSMLFPITLDDTIYIVVERPQGMFCLAGFWSLEYPVATGRGVRGAL